MSLCNHKLTIQAQYYKPQHKLSNTIFICFPGGGSSQHYFNLGNVNGFDHSFAHRMTSQGHQVLTIDHLGTGENPLPKEMGFLKPVDAVQYIAQALDDLMPAMECGGRNVIGIGHSMGGMMTTLMSYYQGMYTAIALFGSSAGGLDWGLSDEEKTYIDKPQDLSRDLEKLTLAKFGRAFTEIPAGPSGKSITFGGETPELTQRLREVSCELYAAGGMMSMVRGSFRKEVEAIDVPIFFAFGDHDIGIPPEDAPKDYINAPSTELVILKNTGHNHFAFSSIQTLCAKLDHWASNLD
jgi:pimeloyl-ACP methyl ester carboxylesterase